jgi:hypothetical protein
MFPMFERLAAAVITVATALNVGFQRFCRSSCLSGPPTLLPFAAQNFAFKSSGSFTLVVTLLNDGFEGCPSPIISTALLGGADRQQ